jgi:hypothetical protein
MKQRLNAAVVNAGCLAVFAGQSTSRQRDVLDSLLYIQLAAMKKHSKFTDFEHWERTWLAAAVRFGWVVRGSEHLSEPVARTGTDTAWALCTAAMTETVGDTLISDVEELLRAGMSSDALNLLSGQTLHVNAHDPRAPLATVVLQAGFVDTHGVMTLAVLHLRTYQPLTSRFLFNPLEAGHVPGNYSVTVYSMQLEDLVYSRYRNAIDTALADKRSSLIRLLDRPGR